MFIHFFRSRDRFVSATNVVFPISAMTSSCSQNLYEEEGYKHVNGIDHFFRIVGEGSRTRSTSRRSRHVPQRVVSIRSPGVRKRPSSHFFQDQRGNGLSLDDIDSETSTLGLARGRPWIACGKSCGIERLNLVGHSWGGLLAMYYAVEHPNKVERLITISSACEYRTPGATS